MLILALISLATQMTPGLVKAVLPLCLELAIFRLSRKKESKESFRVLTINA